MPVDPVQAQTLKEAIEYHYPDDYSFMDWIATTAMLQTIAFGRDPMNINNDTEEFKDFARWNTLGTIAEMIEMLDEVPWKPWASTWQLDREKAVGEIVDAMHFIGNLLRLLAVDGAELTTAYKKKQLKNLQRQIDGYDGKKEKCGYCNRELDSPSTGIQLDHYTCTAPGCSAQGQYCSPLHHSFAQERNQH